MWRRRMGQLFAVSFVTMGVLCGCTGEKAPLTTVAHLTPPTETQQIRTVTFPQTLEDGTLVAEALSNYQGVFWEDGSGDAVENVAALMLFNPTDRMVEFVSVALEQGGKQLYFFAYRLPPQSRCLVLEYNRTACRELPVTDCRELCVRWDRQEYSREQVDYIGLGPRMTIINRAGQLLEHVTVWYKQYVGQEGYYLGGAAYSAHLFFLQPKERRNIYPEYYDAGHARIVAIGLEA